MWAWSLPSRAKHSGFCHLIQDKLKSLIRIISWRVRRRSYALKGWDRMRWHFNQSSQNLKSKENTYLLLSSFFSRPSQSNLLVGPKKKKEKRWGFSFKLLCEEHILYFVTWKDGFQVPERQHYLDANYGLRSFFFSFLRKPLVSKWQYHI